MKKVTQFLIFLFCLAFVFQKLSLGAEDHKSERKNIINSELQLFQANKYLNFYFFPAAYPTLFYPYSPLNMLLLSGQFNFTQLERVEPKKRFGRAVLEGLGHFAYATSSYWIRQDVMKEDWEYQFTWEDQKRRFLFMDGMRFDSNTFQFNWTHSLAGAIYYNYARANHLNPLESFLYGFGASYFWEFVIEFREVVSINDLIGTPMGGISIGESMFQLGRLFRSKRPTFLNKIARFLSNPIMSLNGWLDREKYHNQYPLDNDYWSDCRLYIGPRFDTYPGNDANSFLQLGFESQINLIPEYGQPDVSSRTIKNTAFTEFHVGGALNKEGIYEFNIFAKSTLFGYFIQNIHPAKSHSNTENPNTKDNDINTPDEETYQQDDYVGYSLFLGLASCFDLFKKDPLVVEELAEVENIGDSPDRNDKFCIINLLGPTIDFSLFHKDLKIRLVADAYGDFALIHSHAYKKYSELVEFGQTKSTLENHGYYYALGITLSSLLQVNYSNLEFKGIFKYHYFDSIEGLDRFQKDIEDEDDFNLEDRRWFYNISLGYRIPHTSVQLVLGLEHWNRKGIIGDFIQQSTERCSYFQIKYLF